MRIFYKSLLLLSDLLSVLFAFYLGLFIRFHLEGLQLPLKYFYGQLYWFYAGGAISCLAAFYLAGLYRKVWRYAGMYDVLSVFLAVSAGFVPPFVVVFGLKGSIYPRSAIFTAWFTALLLVGGVRLILRLISEQSILARCPSRKPVLIIGANDAGEMILREMRRHPAMGYVPTGFLDEDPQKRKISIHGVPVLGKRADLPRLASERAIQEVIVAQPSPPLIRELVETCEKLRISLKVVPSISEIIGGHISIGHLRKVEIEDLLDREPVRLDLDRMSEYLQGKTVLVTGAGGSIGSEICRQVAHFKPAMLILMGHGENSIYEAGLELRTRTEVPVRSFIGDMRDRGRMDHLFSTSRPQVVFHCAAHKHVPLMEENAVEAVTTNVFGTMNLAELAAEYSVERFIFLSTDKSVNPVSVMGSSKRLAEMFLIGMAGRSNTRFMAVRFGNVLDSRGSVIPTFRRQISLGGPVTVTHPEMTRYFMTIPEAVALVIQAGAIGEGGEVFILEMGSPVKILDLARNIIRLSGFEPEADIPIQIQGIRPGEKLSEELINIGEETRPTEFEKIVKVRTAPVDLENLKMRLEELKRLAAGNDDEGVRKFFSANIPGYSLPEPKRTA